MIGQCNLFPPEPNLPLRQRVQVDLIPSSHARFVLEKLHYLHRVRTGCQIHYAVSLDGVIDGVITYAFPMTSSPICGIPSDELVEFARMYLHSNVPNMATCAIGQTLKRVAKDWQRKHPEQKPIHLVVSWSDTVHHIGTIYKASNFIWLRRCRGSVPGNASTSKRGAREKHGDYKHDKDCWVYWLDAKEHERQRKHLVRNVDKNDSLAD